MMDDIKKSKTFVFLLLLVAVRSKIIPVDVQYACSDFGSENLDGCLVLLFGLKLAARVRTSQTQTVEYFYEYARSEWWLDCTD